MYHYLLDSNLILFAAIIEHKAVNESELLLMKDIEEYITETLPERGSARTPPLVSQQQQHQRQVHQHMGLR